LGYLALYIEYRIRTILEKCVKNKATATYETFNTTRSGKKIWTQTTLTPMLNADGEVIKLIAIDSDVTKIKEALAEVKTLSGLLPICSSCKKIRDDKGYWNKIEEYIHKHSEAQFSHSICPGCAKKLYPDLNK